MNDNIFLAGAAREDTTPVLGTFLYGYRPDIACKSVHDPLSVTALAVSQYGKTALLLTTAVPDVLLPEPSSGYTSPALPSPLRSLPQVPC